MGKTRVQIDLDDNNIKIIDDIKSCIGASSRVEAIRRSLNLAHTIILLFCSGYSIYAVRGEEKNEIKIIL